ncbi:ribosome recycling factor [Candidatus Woesebacteria bacterium RIFOXYC1_FULL_31_51]|uniref:Ribosome-recycling factor n=1 Tax=Candidatus Woesebacteria bacterium GW2011_GWC2_31_9 TaxID=1618586 RepID=A0A0G0BMM4_9BACT|nr:MAG: Ribosome-recycling factor, ribosome recycling factor [Candidatus Woesebacteria bacterium GW2011_GWF1_31_35]KKP22801.1 MAG: Ribosome-recycling factor [Candidatus Woesebacteria bacterium GW2011_GWC1_30_29]KKP26711.1 MAG: Ribosome-recycling factor [Candidatus Woesebacteria bacterium GW2011_GWD1_31_12]KKP28049.1 MAG: Ribosome-recycling factor [Candidatus Woesebacteria bacterium GW2011_GWB1_31_29]KKP32282.1 MAG: Ribosome-recycling factor [Candidatus Woesebacteria bacterium GW2011_GWC2_31_9]
MDETQVTSKMQRVVDLVVSDISGIRTGRATPSLVENINCPAYGGTQVLKVIELASISAPDTQTLVISPWDKSIIGDIRKGILEANIGMNPSIDGEIIRISFPPLTTEDREKYVKILSGKLENGKVLIRSVRADEMHLIKKNFEDKKITEDEKKDAETKIQELTDLYIGKIESLGEAKKSDLLQI